MHAMLKGILVSMRISLHLPTIVVQPLCNAYLHDMYNICPAA